MKTHRIGVIGLGQRIAHVLGAMREVGWALDVAAATAGAPMQGLRWSGFLTGEPMKTEAKKAKAKKPAAKMPTGAEMKSEERNEPLKVKAHEEDMRSQNVKAARAAVIRAQLPPRKR